MILTRDITSIDSDIRQYLKSSFAMVRLISVAIIMVDIRVIKLNAKSKPSLGNFHFLNEK